ncbi:MAG: FkbM family methyltransferase [Desulfobacteraceae bacterium]
MLHKLKLYKQIFGIKGIYYYIKAMVSKKPTLLEVNKKHYSYPFYLRALSSDISTYKQIFIKNEYNFSLEKMPNTIIDAGANIGLASIYFANKYPTSQIIAIEPEAKNFNLLIKNTASYPNIIPIRAALWNKKEEIKIIDPGLGNWGFMTEEKEFLSSPEKPFFQTVNAITIQNIIEDFNLEEIDILKIDIEGAEKEVFSDTSRWIHRVNSIIIELHERMKQGCNRSFYCGTKGFYKEWTQGENVYLSRKNFIINK